MWLWASSRRWVTFWPSATALCQTLGAAHLAQDARYASNTDRLRHSDALRQDLTGLLSAQDAATLAESLLRAGVPAAAVQNVEDVLNHTHTKHRGMILEQGDYRGIGSPIKLSRTPASLRFLPPELGEHNQDVMT